MTGDVPMVFPGIDRPGTPMGSVGDEHIGPATRGSVPQEVSLVEWFKQLPIGALAIVVGTISVIGWIVFDGTLPLVISIIAGGLIALRASLGNSQG